MIIKNLTEELTKLGLTDFLREIAKKNGLFLNEEGAKGKEWQMGKQTSQGIKMLVVTISQGDPDSRFLNLDGFYLDKDGKRKKMPVKTRDSTEAYSTSLMFGKRRDWELTDKKKNSFQDDIRKAAESVKNLPLD